MHYFKFFTKLQITKFTNNENLKILTNFASWKSRKRHTILIKEQLRDFFVANETNLFVEIKYEWLWSKGRSFEDMTNVSKQTRMLEM
jgi:hypothetical protein